MLKVIKLSPKQTLIKFLAKKGKQESSEKKINQLLLQLKKELAQPPEFTLNQSLNNHKVRISHGCDLNILPDVKQGKYGIRLLSFRGDLLEDILDGLRYTGKSYDVKTKMYSEANQFRFTQKRSRRK